MAMGLWGRLNREHAESCTQVSRCWHILGDAHSYGQRRRHELGFDEYSDRCGTSRRWSSSSRLRNCGVDDCCPHRHRNRGSGDCACEKATAPPTHDDLSTTAATASTPTVGYEGLLSETYDSGSGGRTHPASIRATSRLHSGILFNRETLILSKLSMKFRYANSSSCSWRACVLSRTPSKP